MVHETDDRKQVVYMTLVEAAEEFSVSPDELRRAVRDREIVGIKENPQNTRSRWLVSLDSVRRRYAPPDEEPALHEESAPEDESSLDPVVVDDVADAEIDETSHDDDGGEATETHVTITDGARADVTLLADDGATGAELARGEALIGRLSDAIDRFAAAIPEPAVDYDAMLDRYMKAVDATAEAEVRAATAERRMAEVEERLEQAQEDLDAARDGFRAEIAVARDELRAELEHLRSEKTELEQQVSRLREENARLATISERPRTEPEQGSRPLWRRRKR